MQPAPNAEEVFRELCVMQKRFIQALQVALMRDKNGEREWIPRRVIPDEFILVCPAIGYYKMQAQGRSYHFCRYPSTAFEKSLNAINDALVKREEVEIVVLNVSNTDFVVTAAK